MSCVEPLANTSSSVLPVVDIHRLRAAGWEVSSTAASRSQTITAPTGHTVHGTPGHLTTPLPADRLDRTQGLHATQLAALAALSVAGLPPGTATALLRAVLTRRVDGYGTVELYRLFAACADPALRSAVELLFELSPGPAEQVEFADVVGLVCVAGDLDDSFVGLLETVTQLNPDPAARSCAARAGLGPEIVAYDDDVEVVRAAARCVTAPAHLLVELSTHPDGYVLAGVARNRNTPPDVLTALSASGTYIAVRATAANTATPIEVLTELAERSDVGVATEVAANTNTPPEVLAALSRHAGRPVVLAVARNPATPDGVLTRLAAASSDMEMVRTVAGNRGAPLELLDQLASHDDLDVVREVAYNTNAARLLLRALFAHGDFEVRRGAVLNPSAHD